MNPYSIALRPEALKALITVNALGTLFGLYYYFDQLRATEPYLWIFVPASPIATALMAYTVYRYLTGNPSALADVLAFFANLKYGLWTVTVLLYYSDIFLTGQPALYGFMLLSHLFMAAQAFLVFEWTRFGPVHALVASTWFIVNDFVDYRMGTHTEIPAENVFPAEISAYLLTLAAATVLVVKASLRGDRN